MSQKENEQLSCDDLFGLLHDVLGGMRPSVLQSETLLNALRVLAAGQLPGRELPVLDEGELDSVRELLGFGDWQSVYTATKANGGPATYDELVERKHSNVACKLSFLKGETMMPS